MTLDFSNVAYQRQQITNTKRNEQSLVVISLPRYQQVMARDQEKQTEDDDDEGVLTETTSPPNSIYLLLEKRQHQQSQQERTRLSPLRWCALLGSVYPKILSSQFHPTVLSYVEQKYLRERFFYLIGFPFEYLSRLSPLARVFAFFVFLYSLFLQSNWVLSRDTKDSFPTKIINTRMTKSIRLNVNACIN